MKDTLRVRALMVSAALFVTCVIPVAQALTASPAQALSLADRTGEVRPASTPGQPAECCAPTGVNVPKVGGDFGDQDYSSLTQIKPGNVRNLAGAWVDHLEGWATKGAQESTPVAVGGVLYMQTGRGDVFAVNGVTGKIIWEYKSGLRGNERGVAVSGNRVFSALGGEHVVALNRQTGALIWTTQVGTPGEDTTANGSSTPWTLYYNGLVLVGTENGGGSGMRGHLYALNAADGTVAWTFGATAGPGDPGNDTWLGDSWMLGGGDAWMAPAIDPQLGLIYLTLANPQPRTGGASRAGNDLYTNSLVALQWNTGKLVWYFQSVHHDLWDYDNTMSPVIADVRYSTGVKKVVIYGSKSSWLYYLDAVLRVNEKKVPILAAQATSPTQPIPVGDSLVPTCPQRTGVTEAIQDFASGCEFTPYLNKPVLVTPGFGGGANWALMSFDRQTGLLYVPASETDTAFSTGLPYGQPQEWSPAGERRGGILDAIDPRTNTIAWQIATADQMAKGDGVMTTSTGLLFEGSPSGVLSARSARTGRLLWTWQTGVSIATTPITYAVHGVQYVAIIAGDGFVPDSLWALRLGGPVGQARPSRQIPGRVPVQGVTVAGRAVADRVVMGRSWDAATSAPSRAEDLASVTAMAPAIMTVPAGTTVTFVNPAGNTMKHCAQSFFDPTVFKIGPLAPGQSGSYHFVKRGDYFYNDCAGFPWNTGEIVVT
jgi:PQQ-dependent dehydrogenase (methanol/ethanol family)